MLHLLSVHCEDVDLRRFLCVKLDYCVWCMAQIYETAVLIRPNLMKHAKIFVTFS
jgi:hypothetical protein